MILDEVIEVLQAMKDGKAIEGRREGTADWTTLDIDGIDIGQDRKSFSYFVLDFAHWEFRVKPQPFEIWANVYKDGSCAIYLNKKMAELNCNNDGKTVLLVEKIYDKERKA